MLLCGCEFDVHECAPTRTRSWTKCQLLAYVCFQNWQRWCVSLGLTVYRMGTKWDEISHRMFFSNWCMRVLATGNVDMWVWVWQRTEHAPKDRNIAETDPPRFAQLLIEKLGKEVDEREAVAKVEEKLRILNQVSTTAAFLPVSLASCRPYSSRLWLLLNGRRFAFCILIHLVTVDMHQWLKSVETCLWQSTCG